MRGRPTFFNFSKSQAIKRWATPLVICHSIYAWIRFFTFSFNESGVTGGVDEYPNRILLFTIFNPLYPITTVGNELHNGQRRDFLFFCRMLFIKFAVLMPRSFALSSSTKMAYKQWLNIHQLMRNSSTIFILNISFCFLDSVLHSPPSRKQ